MIEAGRCSKQAHYRGDKEMVALALKRFKISLEIIARSDRMASHKF